MTSRTSFKNLCAQVNSFFAEPEMIVDQNLNTDWTFFPKKVHLSGI